MDPSPLGPPVEPFRTAEPNETPPEPTRPLTVEVATAELRKALEGWVEAIRSGNTQKVRALVASEDDLRTFIQQAQLRIIMDTRPDRGALLDRLVNSARDQPIEIVNFGPGQGTVFSGQRPNGPTASFDHCELRLSYAGLMIDLDLMRPMRFQSGWRVLEIRKLTDGDR